VAAFYADHDASIHIAPELVALGHTATTARDQGLIRASGAEQILTAAQRGWILVTCNGKHFLVLHEAWQLWSQAWQVTPLPQHAGILIIPQQRWLAPQAAQELDRFVHTNPPLANTLYQWQAQAGWVAKP
jgi:hypothetical protein